MTQDKRAVLAGKLQRRAQAGLRHPGKFQRLTSRLPAPRSPFDAALHLALGIAPVSAGCIQDGRSDAMLELLGPRATRTRIAEWRKGRMKPPAWARAILRHELEARSAELSHYAALLAAEPD